MNGIGGEEGWGSSGAQFCPRQRQHLQVEVHCWVCEVRWKTPGCGALAGNVDLAIITIHIIVGLRGVIEVTQGSIYRVKGGKNKILKNCYLIFELPAIVIAIVLIGLLGTSKE